MTSNFEATKAEDKGRCKEKGKDKTEIKGIGINNTLNIKVSDAAISHFKKLIEKEELPGMNLRIYASHPGTALADIGVTFCPRDEEEKTDLMVELGDFKLFIDLDSKEALFEAELDFEEDSMGGQLSIKAPHLKGHKPSEDSSLYDRIDYILNSEINPGLASHGGKVSLVENLDEEIQGEKGYKGKIVVLRFGGGCHGCGMVNVTLKDGIEKTLKEKFPEISEVRDATDHALGENPYYSK